MAEITSVREINVNKEIIKIEFTYLAQYNRDKTYFNNLDFDTAEGESDDSIEYLKDNLNEYLDHNYLDFTKVAAKFFEINEVVDNIKFIDKYGYFKVYRKEFEKTYWFNYYFCSTNNVFVGTKVIFVLNEKWLEV